MSANVRKIEEIINPLKEFIFEVLFLHKSNDNLWRVITKAAKIYCFIFLNLHSIIYNKMLGLFVALIIIIFLIGKIPFFTKSGLKSWFLRVAFLVKVIAGCGLLYVYSHYYDKETSDMYAFFYDGNVVHSLMSENPIAYFSILTGCCDENSPQMIEYYNRMTHWLKPFDDKVYNDNKIIIRLHAVIRFFSGGNIYIHLIIFNFLSFVGLVGFYKFAAEFMSIRRKALLASGTFFIPTILMWGSGMLKESILIFAIGIAIWLIYNIFFKKAKWYYFPIIISLIILLCLIKFYVFLSMIPSLIWLCYFRIRPQKMLLSFITLHIILAIIAFNIHWLLPNYDILQMIADKQRNFINMITILVEAGSAISLPILDGSMWSVIKAIPSGLFNTFCRPHIFEWHNAFALFAAVENLMLNIILIFCLIFTNPKNLKSLFVFISISFVFILFSLCGITTPVLGALVRYKLPGMLFIMATMIIVVDAEKLKKALFKINISWSAKIDNAFTKFTNLCYCSGKNI